MIAVLVAVFLLIGKTNSNFDVSKLSGDLSSSIVNSSNYPSTYTTHYNYPTSIKYQGSIGSCWAFASTTALEKYIKKTNNASYIFSPRHIDYATSKDFINNTQNVNGYNRTAGSGGNFYISSNYLVSNFGPVFENDMPYENNSNLINLSDIQNKNVVLDVNDVYIYGITNESERKACTGNQINEIKSLVYNYGAVGSVIYMQNNKYDYYNDQTYALYVSTTDAAFKSNHAVTIIGWDDNYSVNNFNSKHKPTKNGAFIVQNSYGSGWGNEGIFYVSYEDVNVCNSYMSIMSTDNEVEDNMYMLDELGYNLSIGFSSGSKKYGYALNIFTKSPYTVEEIKEITFATGATGRYKVYYYGGNAYKDNFYTGNMKYLGGGDITHSGYTTFKLNEPIEMGKDIQDFSIMIYYETSSSINPIGVASKNSSYWSTMKLEPNRSFVSTSASGVWTNLSNANATGWTDLYNLGYETTIRVATNNLSTMKQYTKITPLYPNMYVAKGNTISFNTSSPTSNLITCECLSTTKDCSIDFSEISIKSSDPNIIRVNGDNTLTAVGCGVATITFESLNGVTSNFIVTSYGPLEGIMIEHEGISVEKFRTIYINASIYPEYTYEDKTITWSSSNTNVATVDQTGKIYAKNTGDCVITVKASNGATDSMLVKVTKVNAKSVSANGVGNKTYTGKQIKPGVTVTYLGKTLKNKTDYTLSYGKNKSTGKGTITIKFKGSYTGSKTINFYIIPKKVSIKTPKSPAKKTLTVYYYKTTGASGYQIAYRLKGSDTWTYTTASGASKKIKNLKSKKTYQVKVRAYKSYGGTKYYGSWSSTKTIKIK